jgi:hypothetical protein
MSKKIVRERIEMYSEVSKRFSKEMKFYDFSVLYHKTEKIWFIYLDYTMTEEDKETKEQNIYDIKEIECYDGKGWIKISDDFTPEDFTNVFSECDKSKFNTKSIKRHKRNTLSIA